VTVLACEEDDATIIIHHQTAVRKVCIVDIHLVFPKGESAIAMPASQINRPNPASK